MKRGMLTSLILSVVFLTGFAAAQNSLSDLLNQIDTSTVILYAVFIVAFAILFFSLNKFMFKNNKPIAGLVSVVVAFLITYGISKSGLDTENLLGSIGISSGTISLLVGLVIIGGIVFTIIKLKKNSLFVFGGILIVGSFFVYTKTLFIVVGVILIVVGAVLQTSGKGKKFGGGGRGKHFKDYGAGI